MKTKKTIKRNETPKMSLTWFWLHWFAGYAPKSDEDGFTKHRRVTGRYIRKEGEIILKLFYLARSWVLRKNQRGILSRQNLQRFFRLDFGCTFWQSTLEKMFKFKNRHGIQVKADFLEKIKSTLKHKKSLQKHLKLDSEYTVWQIIFHNFDEKRKSRKSMILGAMIDFSRSTFQDFVY